GSADVALDWTHAVARKVAIDTTWGVDVLRVHLDSGQIPAATGAQVNAVVELQRELHGVRTDIKRLRQRHGEFEADQKRVRDNLNVLRKTQGNAALQSELATKLAQQELELGKLSAELVRASEKEASLERQLTRTIQGISLQPQK